MRRRLTPDPGDALGWLALVFFAALTSMAFAMCEAARIPQGFAP